MSAVAVHSEVTGPSGVAPLVLVNSLGTELTMWDGQIPRLSRNRRIVRYDTRGHGRSPAPPGPYTMDDLGADLVALLDRLEIERADVCGISLGGLTAIWLAANQPARVDRLVLANTAARIGTSDGWTRRARTVRAEGTAAVADAVVERFLSPGFRDRAPATAAHLRDGLAALDDEGYAACCLALADADLRGEVGSIVAPTLVITGTEDVATPPQDARWLDDHLADSRLVMLSGVGHLSSIEDPAAFGRAVLDFLRQEPS